MRREHVTLRRQERISDVARALEFARQALGEFRVFALEPPHVSFEQVVPLARHAQLCREACGGIAKAFFVALEVFGNDVCFEQPLIENEEIAAELGDGFIHRLSNARNVMASQPLVSIIIPVYNRSSVTKSCLAALGVSGALLLEPQIIVADDASSDDTLEVAKRFPGVHVLSNPYNLGYIRNCNRAAAHARGTYLVFLDNDTIVLASWLDWLIATAQERPEAGAVGSQVLLPSGKLAEAGLLLARSGATYEYGYDDVPDAPRYNYVRPVDSSGGCSLLIRRDLFYSIGGFAERYAPAYMDDFDLGLAVWERGFQCLYQPLSRLVHLKAMTYGRERAEHLSCRNLPRFARRWAAELAQMPCVAKDDAGRPALEAAARHRCGSRAVLIVDERPYAPYVRRELLATKAQGVHLSYASAAGLEEPQRRDLQQEGIEVLYPYGSRTLWDVIDERLPFVDDVRRPALA